MEINFVPDINGCVPALRTLTEFKVKNASGYFEGTRPNEPDWFYRGEDPKVYEENITGIVADLKDH